MILEAFVVLNASVLTTKMIYKPIVDYHDTFNKVVNEGLYHVTSKENVNNILESGNINPSGHVSSLGTKKTFFFAGVPTLEELTTNVAFELNNETLYAIKVRPSYLEMASFKTRIHHDKAVIYEGAYKLTKENSERVEMVYDYDKDNNIIIREKTKEEYLKYEQPMELKKELEANSKLIASLKNLGVSYLKEFKSLGNVIKNQTYSFVKNSSNKETIEQLKEERTKLLKNKSNISYQDVSNTR